MRTRQTRILELLTENNKMEVAHLAQILNVSQVTIRKDLDALEESGMIVREHGYAKINDGDDINHRLAYHYESKLEIAKLVADTIQDGETLMIESGSCCALVAMEIARTKKDITLITNSAFIAEFIRKYGTVRTILLGGEYQNESQVMVGPMVRECAKVFFVDKLLVGTDGFTKESGFTGNDYMRTEAVRDMARQASQVIVITDSIKFNQKGTVQLLELSGVSSVYTDDGISLEMLSYLEKQGIQVFTAKKGSTV